MKAEQIFREKSKRKIALSGLLGPCKKGRTHSKSREETISVSSWEILGRILSPPRLQILTAIPHFKPKSISELAKAMKKDFKNVYSHIKFLADLGLVELREKGPKKTLVPIAKFDGIELALAA